MTGTQTTTIRVEGTQGSFTQKVRTSQHELWADEPTSLGGQDRGPSPYEYLLTALGACTSMTLEMYARRKDWPLKSVLVELSHQKIHARDCADCEQDKGYLDLIERKIELRGELTKEQRARLMEIADKCPVHKTLSQGPTIKSVLVPNDSSGVSDAQ